MITIIDSITIILLIFGAVIGFKKGVIKSAVSFFGTLLVIFLAMALKDPISKFMYMHFPFFNFSGALAGVTVLNIIIYEAISFFIVFSVLEVLLKVVLFATGIIEKLLNLTIIFGLFSKILGLIFGFIEYYIIIFVALFILSNFSNLNPMIEESVVANKILMNTPILKDAIKDEEMAIREIILLKDIYKNNSAEYNKNAFEILLKYHVISPDSAKELVAKDKIKISGAEEIIKKYESEAK